jgi:ribosomal protein S18 acetylase RimI-like enzyme
MEKNEVISPDELKALQTKKADTILDYTALTESSLKNIDELHKLFPQWQRQVVIRKLKLTSDGKNMRFVARKNGKIIAHIKAVLGTGVHAHIVNMTSITVDPKEKEQGIALGLMQYAISKLPKRIIVATVSVDSKDKTVINLYKKIGFERYGLLKKASKINGKFVDNYLMEKQFS